MVFSVLKCHFYVKNAICSAKMALLGENLGFKMALLGEKVVFSGPKWLRAGPVVGYGTKITPKQFSR